MDSLMTSSPGSPQRGRPARKPPPRASSALRETLNKLRAKQGPSVAELMGGWSEIAGERLAHLTRPTRLGRPGPSGILHIDAEGPAAMLAEANAARILERANLYCGRVIACRVNVTQAPVTQRSQAKPAELTGGVSPRAARDLERSLEPIADPGLKDALRSLGRSVLAAGAKSKD